MIRTSSKNSSAGRFQQVPSDLVEKWQQAYPAVNVLSELRHMEAWASVNPVNRKSNWQRFIVNWLTRAQDRAVRGGSAPVRQMGEAKRRILERKVIPLGEIRGKNPVNKS